MIPKKQLTDAQIFDAYEGKHASQNDVAKQFGLTKAKVAGAIRRERERRFWATARPMTDWLRDMGRCLNQLDALVKERCAPFSDRPDITTSGARAAVYKYAYENLELGDTEAHEFLKIHSCVSPWCPPMWNWKPDDDDNPNQLRRVK